MHPSIATGPHKPRVASQNELNRKVVARTAQSAQSQTVHFIYNTDAEPDWIEYLAVKAALIHLHATTVKIWLPARTTFHGDIWRRIEDMPSVQIQGFDTPDNLYGHTIERPEIVSDIMRLKILQEEGGIYLDQNLVTLKPAQTLDDSALTGSSTVLAQKLNTLELPNWMIMANAKAPFIDAWLSLYPTASHLGLLNKIESHDAASKLDPKNTLKILDGKKWFYPLTSEMGDEAALAMLWFGQTWQNIDDSDGTHLRDWNNLLRSLITPDVVRNINTPLFCRLRQHFDRLDGSDYRSKPWNDDPECQITKISEVKLDSHRLFADYEIIKDLYNSRLDDSSGHHLHGWAVNNTNLHGTGASKLRRFEPNSFAILPVPLGWDARVWTLQAKLRLDPLFLDDLEMERDPKRNDIQGFFQIRMNQRETVYAQFQVERNQRFDHSLHLNLTWTDRSTTGDYLTNTFTYYSPDMSQIQEGPHELTISHDRQHTGRIEVSLDGIALGDTTAPLITRAMEGQEIWLNAKNLEHHDTGLRGELMGLKLYADALGSVAGSNHPTNLNPSTASSAAPLKLQLQALRARATAHPVFIFPFFVSLVCLTLALRRKSSLSKDLRQVVPNVFDAIAKTCKRVTNMVQRISRSDQPGIKA